MYVPRGGGEMKRYKHMLCNFILYEEDKKLFWYSIINPFDMINMKYSMNRKNRIFM